MADPRFHKNQGPFSLAMIAEKSGCTILKGDPDQIINDVASLSTADQGTISFLDNIKYKSDLHNTKAGACILNQKMISDEIPDDVALLTSDTPYKSYALAASLFYPPMRAAETKIHPTAVIADSAEIGDSVIIEANTVIGDGVKIGNHTHIGANVTISHALIGDYVRIHTGTKIGQDGFGFAIDPAGFVPVPQLGRVVIKDHVNIGANNTIDRGSGPDTVIGEGTFIDNLVQIAHNVKIGRGCVIVSQVGISGSTEIDDFCVLGGQAGVAGHLKIGKGVQVGAQSGVTKDVTPGQKLMGFPARPIKEFWRDMARVKKLLSKQ